MRQVGVLAAPCIIALEKISKKLKQDHINALKLAKGIEKLNGIGIDLKTVESNIVLFRFQRNDMNIPDFLKKMQDLGIKMVPFSIGIRATLHHQISEEDVDYVIKCFEKILSK